MYFSWLLTILLRSPLKIVQMSFSTKHTKDVQTKHNWPRENVFYHKWCTFCRCGQNQLHFFTNTHKLLSELLFFPIKNYLLRSVETLVAKEDLKLANEILRPWRDQQFSKSNAPPEEEKRTMWLLQRITCSLFFATFAELANLTTAQP